MAFNNNLGCPEGWTRDEWMREVPRNETTGEFLENALPCDLPLAGFWICSAILILARILLGSINLYTMCGIKKGTGKRARKLRGLAPTFDILNTVFVILFVGLAPVTSSRNGTSWVLFGLAFCPYFVSGILFLMKMIRNRRRIGASGGSSGPASVRVMGNPNFKLRDDSWLVFLLSLCWLGTIGSTVVWIIGAAAFGGNVICHRLAIVLFTLMTSTAQLVAFSESVRTAIELSRHLERTGAVVGRSAGTLRAVRYKLLRTAVVFVPMWTSSTIILLLLAAGVLPFFWYITFILMSMPVVNASAATAMFFRRRRAAPVKDSPSPRAGDVPEFNDAKLGKTKFEPSNFGQTTVPINTKLTTMKSFADPSTGLIVAAGDGGDEDDDE